MALALFALSACTTDPKPSEPVPNTDDTASDGSGTDDVGAADGDKGPATGSTAPGKTTGLDAGKRSDPGTASDAATQKDAGGAAADASVVGIDSGLNSGAADATAPVADAGKTDPGEVDAATSEKDAGGGTRDASSTKDAASPKDANLTDPSSACSGDTPHGCYVARDDNPTGCPAQIHEQSAFYPPMDEWVACSSPYYTPCNYKKPNGGDDAHCECDLGLHWLCTY